MSRQPWLRQYPDYMTLEVKVKPASRKNALSIDANGALVIALQAAAQDGMANKLLIKYLSGLLHIPQKNIAIQRGKASRFKVLNFKLHAEEQKRIIKLMP